MNQRLTPDSDSLAPAHEQKTQDVAPSVNPTAFSDNASLPGIATITPLKPHLEPHISEPSPAQTSPSDDASSNAQLVPETHVAEQTQHSHPTPPPDQPYPTVGHEPTAVTVQSLLSDEPPAVEDSIAQPQAEPATEPVAPVMPADPTPAPQGLPLAGTPQNISTPPQPTEQPTAEASTESVSQLISQIPSQPESEMQTQQSLVRPREDDPEEDEPSAKRSKVEDEAVKSEPAPVKTEPEAPAVVSTDVAMPDAPVSSIEPSTPTAAPGPSGPTQYYTNPMTELQKSFLVDKTKNLKKTKHAVAFMIPVDPVKLNIPNYPNIVKNPMDLGTLENKLKNDQYRSPQEYADDFNLIVTNTRLFNGDAHAVTIAAFNMEAYFKKYMSTLPGPEDTAQPKTLKRASPVAPRPQPRREARQPPPAPVSPAVGNQTFALQPDGTPQIRRDSTTKRPHRTIKPPANRELSYAKPKRKEHQLELKFCEHVLEEIRSPKYGRLNHIFQTPVDPVALNIPHYRQVIKHPMDLTTMSQKLKTGQYATAPEFRADFELMVNNCLVFNPPGNPVRDIGVELRREFNALWDEKAKWERANKKSSERASSDSEESEEESEDDEEDAAQIAAQATIAALTKQLAELQKTMATQWGDGKKKKSKDGKKKEKKSSLGGSAKSKPASKPKAPKKVKPLTYEDKNEISNAVGNMNEAQVGKLTQIITDNCEKYRDMGDDMELEIDDLPNEVQHMLLKHVRSIFGNPHRNNRMDSPDDLAAEDDDDYKAPARERAAAAGGNKRKKRKPMNKKEQQENIAELQKSLAAFNNPASDSGSPTSASYQAQVRANDTSGDEESEESEEE